MRIGVSRGARIGAGQCAFVVEEVFDQDDEGLVLLLDEVPERSDEGLARRAASLCPARAIVLSE